MSPDPEVINRWIGSAPYWEQHGEVIRQMFQPVTAALAKAAKIQPSSKVVDIAAAPGEPSLSIASLAASDGRVVATDAVAEMVSAGRRAAIGRKILNADFTAALGDALPFPSDSFDAAICRFGAMFFPYPVKAVRE